MLKHSAVTSLQQPTSVVGFTLISTHFRAKCQTLSTFFPQFFYHFSPFFFAGCIRVLWSGNFIVIIARQPQRADNFRQAVLLCSAHSTRSPLVRPAPGLDRDRLLSALKRISVLLMTGYKHQHKNHHQSTLSGPKSLCLLVLLPLHNWAPQNY